MKGCRYPCPVKKGEGNREGDKRVRGKVMGLDEENSTNELMGKLSLLNIVSEYNSRM